MRLLPFLLLAACASNTDEVETLQQEVTDLADALALLQSDDVLPQVVDDIANLQSRMDAAESGNDTLAGAQAAVELRVTAAEADADAMASDVTSLTARVVTLEETSTQTATTVATLTDSVAANEAADTARQTTTNARLDALEADTLSQAAAIASVRAGTLAQATTIASISANTSELGDALTEVQGTVQDLGDDVAELQGAGGGLEVLGDVVFSGTPSVEWEALDLSPSVGEREVLVLLQIDWLDDNADESFFFRTNNSEVNIERNTSGIAQSRVRTIGVAELLVLTDPSGTVYWRTADPVDAAVQVTVLAAIP